MCHGHKHHHHPDLGSDVDFAAHLGDHQPLPNGDDWSDDHDHAGHHHHGDDSSNLHHKHHIFDPAVNDLTDTWRDHEHVYVGDRWLHDDIVYGPADHNHDDEDPTLNDPAFDRPAEHVHDWRRFHKTSINQYYLCDCGAHRFEPLQVDTPAAS